MAKDAINTHIQLQLYASYTYLSMAFYCNCDNVALENFKRSFLSKSHKHKATAEMFLFLQNQRRGRSILHDIPRPDHDGWRNGFQAMDWAFHLERTINQCFLSLNWLATEKGNAHLCDFLKTCCLDQQVQVLNEMDNYLTIFLPPGDPEDPMAEYLFDKLTLT
uniref:Ferritin n=1 Tax=Nannospalax galili TaxID=1026970 RepID=A0A8C6RV89_NANGA